MSDLLLEINKIMNDARLTPKLQRILLRQLGLDEKSILELVPLEVTYD